MYQCKGADSGAVKIKVLVMVVFLYYSFVSGSVEYFMPYAFCLASCSVVWSCSSSQIVFPVVLCLMHLSLS